MKQVHAGTKNLVLAFSEIGLKDVPEVGGKNSSLGHLYNVLRPKGLSALDGYCTTSEAYRLFLRTDNLGDRLTEIFKGIKKDDLGKLLGAAEKARTAILSTPLPSELTEAILTARKALFNRLGKSTALAIRSSATAEDLPTASFAGQHDSFLNVVGEFDLLQAVRQCYASLFNERAIDYRLNMGLGLLDVSVSVGIQPMVRSDLASAGVMFTLDPESGFKNVVSITGSFGLGESVVQGSVDPDEWSVFKPTLAKGLPAIIGRRKGSKKNKITLGAHGGTEQEWTSATDQARFCLNDQEVEKLARAAVLIEKSYGRPMDIEWAKDGGSGELFIVQARPETVRSVETTKHFEMIRLNATDQMSIISGQAVGTKVSSGHVRIVSDLKDLDKVKDGDVLVAQNTNPDWEPVMKRAAALITDEGGRTSHAAIVSRELGLRCTIVGAGNATELLKDGQLVTVSCAEGSIGNVYEGELQFDTQSIDYSALPKTKTHLMLNVGDPYKAFDLSSMPCDGVGLARIEFVITSSVGVHPMALANYPKLKNAEAIEEIKSRIGKEDAKEFFVSRLAEGVARIAAAFYPRPVIVRTSDFKSNEYARLAGGREFEWIEENPMIGFRGASRYFSPRYAAGFALECAALKRVRDEMGFTNVIVMIPFCRTVEEGRSVIAEMAKHGLHQGANGLTIYAMCEIPSNALLAKEFLDIFDGYSIGSNDLTQLTLGVDRDSGELSSLFDERDPAVKDLISRAIAGGHEMLKPIGICGQAPSDYPDFAAWLVTKGITSISVNPDAFVRTLFAIDDAEKAMNKSAAMSSTK